MNKFVLSLIILIALIAGVLGFYQFSSLPQPEHALYYKTPRAIQPVQLTNHKGESFTNQNFKGQWSWIFFGYTSCPDVCPTTLQELNFIYDDLTQIAPNQVLLVSVDPQRDSQEKLAQYIGYFNSAFIALRAEHDVLYPFARNMGLMYAIVDNKDDNQTIEESYLVNHSASIVLVNPDGLIAAIFKPEQALGQIPSIEGDKLVSDFSKIVRLHSR